MGKIYYLLMIILFKVRKAIISEDSYKNMIF